MILILMPKGSVSPASEKTPKAWTLRFTTSRAILFRHPPPLPPLPTQIQLPPPPLIKIQSILGGNPSPKQGLESSRYPRLSPLPLPLPLHHSLSLLSLILTVLPFLSSLHLMPTPCFPLYFPVLPLALALILSASGCTTPTFHPIPISVLLFSLFFPYSPRFISLVSIPTKPPQFLHSPDSKP